MTNKRPILFATDGSPSAEEARKEAFGLARRLDAPLLVVSVAHAVLPAFGYAAYGYSNVVAELGEAEHKRVKALLAKVAEEADEEGVSCSTLAAEGIVVDEICRRASEHDVQLIVVGSHGWGATRRLLSGSISTGLVHTAPCPVLVFRGRQPACEQAEAA
jgi:nucleotide-binding universal stress UspA family protein